MKSYRCSCGVQFDTKKAMVAHYRKQHPDNGYGCWDQIGDIGDKFANDAMEACQKRTSAAHNEVRELKAALVKYENMGARVNELVSAMNAIGFVIDNLRRGNRAER